MLSVAEIMSQEIYTLTEQHTVADAWTLIEDHRIHHLPITDEDATLRGLVSHHDLLRAGDSQNTPLGDIMIRKVQTTDEHASVRGAALYLHKNRVRCLPVVEEGKLIGIVTDTDFVAVAIHLMELLEQSESEPDYSE